MKITVGTRGSKLALAQASKVIEGLKKEGFDVRLRIIKTTGDIKKDRPLYEFKGVGAFVQSLDLALAKGVVDIAVHSYKDVPSKRIEGTVIAAVLKRDSPRDALISRDGRTLSELSPNSIIGTSSLRRRAQFRRLRRDLRFTNIRGNLDTRIKKLKRGMYDAIIVAEAGLTRLGLDKKVKYQSFPPHLIVPSPNQGIIAIATRKGEEDLVSFLNDQKTWLEAKIERTVTKELGLGCTIPIGAYAEAKREVRLIFEVFAKKYIRIDECLPINTAIEDAFEIARNVKSDLYG